MTAPPGIYHVVDDDPSLVNALFDNYFLACELRDRGIDLVARAP
jgi:hypothetical protein